MRRLILVRHAKSSRDAPGLDDFARPLAGRGREAARWIGRELHRLELGIGRVLCSPAERARQTLELALVEAPQPGLSVSWDARVYGHRDDDYVELVRGAEPETATLMIVGHNPATAETAAALAGHVETGLFADVVAKFPTGSIAVLEFDAPDWAAVRPGTGRLTRFLRPPRD